MKVLVAGGAGFIGSHTMVELLNAGYEVVCVDNFSNSNMQAVLNVQKICNKKVTFYQQDLQDLEQTLKIFENEKPFAVIHFAGFKAVGESVKKPLMYYQNNINTTISLLNAMQKTNCKNMVFSSSATVYGNPKVLPIKETSPTGNTTNPYGTTKLFIEKILQDVQLADSSLNIALLRYFNPIGAHESGLIGENPNGIPNNLLPYVAQVATGKLPYLKIFGNDYDTPDGTGVRDYIHVVDLAKGHISALEKLKTNCGMFVCNLGTGHGYSVLEVVKAYEKACGKKIKFEFAPRREGDIATCYADVEFAKEQLHWQANLGIDKMCESSFNYEKNSSCK